MSQFPMLPLYCDAWTIDTKHLSRSERGTYLDLLILLWTSPKCRVPNDRKWIARKLGVPADDAELERIISEFCRHDKHWLWQQRLLKEFSYVADKGQKQSIRAKSRWNKEKKVCRGNAPLPIPIPIPRSKKDPPLLSPPQGGRKKWSARNGGQAAGYNRRESIAAAIEWHRKRREEDPGGGSSDQNPE